VLGKILGFVGSMVEYGLVWCFVVWIVQRGSEQKLKGISSLMTKICQQTFCFALLQNDCSKIPKTPLT